MLSKKLEEALNAQINSELWAAYVYLSMSAHFASEGKPGIARWFQAHSIEEQNHAMRIFNFIISRGSKIELLPIVKVPTSFKSPLAAFEAALKQEQAVTGQINYLMTLAKEERDYASENMLHWFIKEQLEEEITMQKYIDALKMIGDNGFGLYTFDKEITHSGIK